MLTFVYEDNIAPDEMEIIKKDQRFKHLSKFGCYMFKEKNKASLQSEFPNIEDLLENYIYITGDFIGLILSTHENDWLMVEDKKNRLEGKVYINPQEIVEIFLPIFNQVEFYNNPDVQKLVSRLKRLIDLVAEVTIDHKLEIME